MQHGSPFWHYNTVFDPLDAIERHAAPDLVPIEGFYTSYFGVVIDPSFFPAILPPWAGTVERETIPANWHADIAEFGAALRAVDLSGDRFVMAELGCGWGCWMNLTGAAARRSGRRVHLIGVEGDASHAQWATQSLTRNGFASDAFVIHRGIAAARRGIALFPRVDSPGTVWGSAPILDASWLRRYRAARRGSHDALPMIPIDVLAKGHDRIDLLHIDIQGGEADLIAGSLAALRHTVAYIVIGTHSRSIEGRLFDLLLGDGWRLEIERPLTLSMDNDPPATHVDGVQGWRNPRLLPL